MPPPRNHSAATRAPSLSARTIRTGSVTFVRRGAQVVVGLTDVEPEVVHPDAPPRRDRRGVRADFDEEQLVMRASRGEAGGADGDLPGSGQDLPPAQYVAVGGHGAPQGA